MLELLEESLYQVVRPTRFQFGGELVAFCEVDGEKVFEDLFRDPWIRCGNIGFVVAAEA